jgi:hypothetical protein
MSQYEPPFQPDYASYGMKPPSLRPTSVTVIAIIAIILGGLGVLGLLCTLPQYLGVKLAPNPVMDAMRNDRVLFWFMIISMAIGTVLAVIQLWGGIGALTLKPAARSALIWYAIVYLVTGTIGLILNVTIINARTQEAVNKSLASNPQLNSPAMKTSMQMVTYGGHCFAAVLLIWPVIILYFMTRPHVKAAFERGWASPGDLPPIGGPPPLGP